MKVTAKTTEEVEKQTGLCYQCALLEISSQTYGLKYFNDEKLAHASFLYSPLNVKLRLVVISESFFSYV